MPLGVPRPFAELTVFNLLAVTRRLLEFLNDEGSSRRNDIDLGDTVLDGQFASNLKSLPILSGLGNIFTDLLGGETERTDLRGEGRSSTNFSTDASEVY